MVLCTPKSRMLYTLQSRNILIFMSQRVALYE